jgi:hypothetical protein
MLRPCVKGTPVDADEPAVGSPRNIGLLALLMLTTAALPPGGTFVDDNGNLHEGNIEAIAAAGITVGCATSPARPDGDPWRNGDPSPPGPGTCPADLDHFTDDNGSIFEDSINRLATAGITDGCGPASYCPEVNITREQMAALPVAGYGYVSPGADRFLDDEGSKFEDHINLLAQAEVTAGCAPQRFCPADPVLRDQMATFLARSEGLQPIPVPASCPILPPDNIWNTRIDALPVHSRSDQYVASIGPTDTLHAEGAPTASAIAT